jgi:(heptosyl)LPS beta-1,4-glucosyltransferase
VGITALMIARDEADRIPISLESLAWVDEVIVVVDAATVDNTAALCRQAGAQVIIQPWKGYAQQLQAGLDHASQQWILLIDADERVTPKLRTEIERVTTITSPCVAYEIPSYNLFLGRQLRSWYPDRHLRLVQRNKGYFPDKSVHVFWAPFEAGACIGRLNGDFTHDSYRDLRHCVTKWTAYAELGARDIVQQKPVRNMWGGIGEALWDFFKYQILKRGFLDGPHSLTYNWIHAFIYTFLKYAYAYEMTLVAEREKAAAHTAPRAGA